MDIINPEQLADEGQAEFNRSKYLSAARLFQAATDGYLAAKEDLLAAEMANNCSVAFLKGGDAQSALDIVKGTDEVFERNGDNLRTAMAIGNQAAALEGVNRLDEAIEAYEKSAELLKELGEFELRAYVLQAISSIKLRRGRYLEAYAFMRDGIVRIEKPTFRQKLLKSLIDLPFKFLR